MILSYVSCFIQGEVIGFQVPLDRLDSKKRTVKSTKYRVADCED